ADASACHQKVFTLFWHQSTQWDSGNHAFYQMFWSDTMINYMQIDRVVRIRYRIVKYNSCYIVGMRDLIFADYSVGFPYCSFRTHIFQHGVFTAWQGANKLQMFEQ